MPRSILNDVLGPVMRGPSSSHTAGSFNIGRIVRELVGETPLKIEIYFDEDGSYGATYDKQNADKGFVAGLLGVSLLDGEFNQILEKASSDGIKINFEIKRLNRADHPNYVELELTDSRRIVHRFAGKSVGGGSIEICGWNNRRVSLKGTEYGALVFIENGIDLTKESEAWLKNSFDEYSLKHRQKGTLITIKSRTPFTSSEKTGIKEIAGKADVRLWSPLYYPFQGKTLYESVGSFIEFAVKKELSAGAAAIAGESSLLGIDADLCRSEMYKRYEIMEASIEEGMDDSKVKMNLLKPSAGAIAKAVSENRVVIGGPHALAGARAMAVMHACNSGGVVCAAPTGGAAGVIPAVISTLREELNLSKDEVIRCLFAAGAVGWAVSVQATFAAESAGCQVEIGAAGAMGAAAVVEAAGGSLTQAFDAAAIAFQNSMGSVCDLVQGMCEIPCHTRNAAAASNAFLCADLILGGYENPIPLAETIDAVYSTGKMLPSELRCTARGGIAVTPSAMKLGVY